MVDAVYGRLSDPVFDRLIKAARTITRRKAYPDFDRWGKKRERIYDRRGYGKTFGVIAVDRKTQTRYPKESLKVLGSLAKQLN